MTAALIQHNNSRREFLKRTGTGMAALAAISLEGCGAGKIADQPPSILFLLTNGLGWGDPGCYNPLSKIPTPNIDRIAREGMRFTDAHSSAAISSPSRYGIMTGRYAWRAGFRAWDASGYSTALIEPGRMTIASLLKSRGYATACVGVWHLGLGSSQEPDFSQPLHPSPLDYGFDHFYGIPSAPDQPPYLYIENDHATALPTETIAASPLSAGYAPGAAAPGYRHEEVLPAFTTSAVKFLEENAASAKTSPFFLCYALPSPNRPWIPSAEFQGKSAVGPYGDMVMETDAAIGDILTALDRLGLSSNTLVVLTSVCGPDKRALDPVFGHNPSGPYRGQQADAWEGGHRVPFLVRWPEHVAQGAISDELICLTDLMATCAEITGETLPENAGEDSFSILPAFVGKMPDKPIRPNLITASGTGLFVIREGKWKMINGRGGGGYDEDSKSYSFIDSNAQVYNLNDDPGEQNNLFDIQITVGTSLNQSLYRNRTDGRSRPAGTQNKN
jgi:arylsulfatase A